VLRQAIDDGVGSLLILEDDVCLCDDFAAQAAQFLAIVPSDWQGIMFGGQDIMPSRPLGPGISRCWHTERGQLWAFRDAWMKEALRLGSGRKCAIDSAICPDQWRYRVYRPPAWLAGQRAGISDLTGRLEEERWWGK
jgi:hypothetical protein